MTKRSPLAHLAGVGACLATMALATAANAAIVSYTSDTFDNVTDVSTTGTLVTAVNLGTTTGVAVNGVLFAGDPVATSSFVVVATDFSAADVYDSGTNPITGLSAVDADALLDPLEFGLGDGNSLARVSGLTIGASYEVQIFASTDGTTLGGLTVDFGYATPSGDATKVFPLTSVAGVPPVVVTGTWVADETVQDFHVAFNSNNAVVSGFQLRQVPEPVSIFMLGLGITGMTLARRRRVRQIM